jgi:hypothetical protein
MSVRVRVRMRMRAHACAWEQALEFDLAVD